MSTVLTFAVLAGNPVRMAEGYTVNNKQASPWLPGLLASSVISLLYAVYIFYTLPNVWDISGAFVLALVVLFFALWLLCAAFAFVWGKQSFWMIRILLALGFLAIVLELFTYTGIFLRAQLWMRG